jgi:hypothetical protein
MGLLSRIEGNIQINLKELEYEVVDRILVAQDKEKRRDLANDVMNICFHTRP